MIKFYLVTIVTAALASIGTSIFMTAVVNPVSVGDVPSNFTAFEVLVRDGVSGAAQNEKFFVGRLPELGEQVNYVFVGKTEDGHLRFQLHVQK